MSRFMSLKHSTLKAYTPGEQPNNRKYIKLNTNESPFPPSPAVTAAVEKESRSLQLYSDPECRELNLAVADYFGVKTEQLLMTNGSDEILNFAFMAFGDESHPFAFPETSYGFYPVFADINHIPYKAIPLKSDYTIDADDYVGLNMNIVIANPNAPTGTVLTTDEVEKIVASNPNNVVVIDEAYVDFGGQSCVFLIDKYDNLIVTRTFSKSYSLAGARLGFGLANEALIADMNTIKYSTNPYNVNRMTSAAGVAAIRDSKYYLDNCKVIMKNREYTKDKLREMGFTVLESKANFLFASHPVLDGKTLYQKLKSRGILIRHFDKENISNFNRITIGTKEQMDALLSAIETLLKEGDVQ